MIEDQVSVLLPTHQSARFVRRAIESVLAQTRAGWQLVVVDNASTDGTFEIASEYAAADRRISVHRNAVNIGPVANWRRCADLATGDLACLLFSDDWYEPSFIEALAPSLADPKIGLAYAAARIVGNGTTQTAYSLQRGGRRTSREYLRSALVEASPQLPVSPCCAMVRLTDLRRWLRAEVSRNDVFAFDEHGAGPDLWVFLQAWQEYEFSYHDQRPLVTFRKHVSNLSGTAGVGEAYAWARLDFAEHRAQLDARSLQRARAKCLLTLRRHPMRRVVAPRLSAAGWLYAAALGVNWVVRTVAKGWVGREGASKSARPRQR